MNKMNPIFLTHVVYYFLQGDLPKQLSSVNKSIHQNDTKWTILDEYERLHF